MKISSLAFSLLLCCTSLFAKGREFYQIKVYHLKTAGQEARVDSFLQMAYLPALHRAGIKQVGVFKPANADTAGILIYVLIPFRNLEQFNSLNDVLNADKVFQRDGQPYINAVYDDAPFGRVESILLRAFTGMPAMATPALTGPKSERIYELRSYESPTEKYHVNKVKMFNDGDEVGIFKKLGFNAVFYGEVLSGSRMPNLMYMTTFNNKAERDEHWKAFSADEHWKEISAMQEYSHNVSKSDILFLTPTNYSDY